METLNRGFNMGNLTFTMDSAVGLVAGIVVLMMFIYSGNDIEVDRAEQVLAHVFTDAEKNNHYLKRKSERHQNDSQVCRQDNAILQKRAESCSENLQKCVAEIISNEKEVRSCLENHLTDVNKVRENHQERYIDCVEQINQQTQKYERCREELNKKESEFQKTNSQLQLARKDDEINVLRRSVAHHEEMRQIRHLQDQVELREESISDRTKAQLDNLKGKLLRLTRKKCAGFFSSGESVDTIKWEQDEIRQYIASIDDLQGIDVLGGLEQIFKDPCDMDEKVVDGLIEKWMVRTDNRRMKKVLMSLKQHQEIAMGATREALT
ncbi:ribonuclease Y-like [Ptychodera flava]|uniref:ribonuclease Y-like n=1 Tax=Ptychodera flava TaxID=63121 RepID=UPI00396A82DE